MPEVPKKEERKEPRKEERKEAHKPKEDDIKHRVRVAGVILDGSKDVSQALTDVKGIGIRLSRILTQKLGYLKGTKLGTLNEKDIERIEETIVRVHTIAKPWMLNRQRDYLEGTTAHLTGSDLDLSQREDITKQKRIKSYRGVRHATGQPVRGQRTRSTFRTGSTIGVVRKKAVAAAAAAGQKK